MTTRLIKLDTCLHPNLLHSFCFPKVPTFNGLIVPTQKQKIEKTIQTLRAGNVTLFADVKESKKPLKKLTLINKSHCFRRQHSTINVHNKTNKDNYYYTKILPELHGVSVGTQIISHAGSSLAYLYLLYKSVGDQCALRETNPNLFL